MPLYQQVIMTLPKASPDNLCTMFRKYAEVVFHNNGIVRGIESHGVRSLPERTKRKYPTIEGDRYFWKSRYTTVTFYGTPSCLKETDRFLKNEELVLRQTTMKIKGAYERHVGTNYKNPYLAIGVSDKK